MFGALLITLREGLEAALIIGIILAYLVRTDNRQSFKYVWFGTLLAVAASVIAGVVIYFTAGELEGRPEQIFEGLATFIAAGVLTWMIFWMRRQAVNIRNELQAQIESALGRGSSTSLLLLSFVAVVREGIETVLFLFAATKVAESPGLFVLGALLGLASAVGVGYGIYKGTARLNLRVFFNVTSPLLILFAAGLLAHGIMEFHEAGIIPTIVEHVWDTSAIIPEQSVPGIFLTTIFGYSSSPSLVQVVVYFGYLLSILFLYFRPALRR
jgi:high-affinity iron transporter